MIKRPLLTWICIATAAAIILCLMAWYVADSTDTAKRYNASAPEPVSSVVRDDQPSKARTVTTAPEKAQQPRGSLPNVPMALPKGTGWGRLYEALMPRALAGDSAAASRLYRETLHCLRLASVADRLEFMLKTYRGSQASAVAIENQASKLASMQAELEQYSEICAGIEPKVISEALYPIMRQSALLGNEHAAACYVYAGMFELGPYTESQKAAFRSDYEEQALAIAESGIEGGSWEMVGLMRTAYGSDGGASNQHGWLNAVVTADPLKFYAYWLLEQIGMASRGAARSGTTCVPCRDA